MTSFGCNYRKQGGFRLLFFFTTPFPLVLTYSYISMVYFHTEMVCVRKWIKVVRRESKGGFCTVKKTYSSPSLSLHGMDSMSIDNRDGDRSSRTMTKTLSLYLSLGWLGASRGQQGASGCRGDPPPGKGWPLSPCPPPGKPLCLWSHPWCCHAGFTFPAPQVSPTLLCLFVWICGISV